MANIFMDGDTCKLAGYENTLLGYRSSFHNLCSDDVIDTIMFGEQVDVQSRVDSRERQWCLVHMCEG